MAHLKYEEVEFANGYFLRVDKTGQFELLRRTPGGSMVCMSAIIENDPCSDLLLQLVVNDLSSVTVQPNHIVHIRTRGSQQ